MSVAKRHILPFFIPHLGCPNQCIFCDQRRISGQKGQVWPEDLAALLAKIDGEICPELAFYGGSFTAIDEALQVAFLTVAEQAWQQGKISGIRVSTRPDAIDGKVVARLKQFGVKTVELGVQSMTDSVLAAAKRGHTAEDSLGAVRLLKDSGFVCGVQLMPGLPGETAESAILGAARILRLSPDMLRIYPTVVVEGTELAELYKSRAFAPLDLAAAVDITLKIKLLAEHFGVNVIRMGLQPTEELASEVLAGPYHPAFGFLVSAAMWRQKLLFALDNLPDAVECFVNKRDIAAVVGDKRGNLPHYPKGLRIRGAELANGGILLKNAKGMEYYLADEEFRQRFEVAFLRDYMIQ